MGLPRTASSSFVATNDDGRVPADHNRRPTAPSPKFAPQPGRKSSLEIDSTSVAASDSQNTNYRLLEDAVVMGNAKVESAHVLAGIKPSEPEVPDTPFFAYILLAAVVVGLSAMGPVLDVQKGVDSTMKIAWANGAAVFVLLPVVAHSVMADGMPQLSANLWLLLIGSSACNALSYVLFAWALDYTSVGNVVILSNTRALMLLVGKLFMGEPISRSEGAGAIVAFLGAIICAQDAGSPSEAESSDDDGEMLDDSSHIGEVYALLSALASLFYMIGAKKIQPRLKLSVFMFFVMLICTLECLLFMVLCGEHFSVDADINIGIFGWMNYRSDRLPTEAFVVLFSSIVGSMGFVLCMKYFSNLIISVATLMQPVIADILAVILGVGEFPSVVGWIGNILVVLGTLCVVSRKEPDSAETT